MPFRKFKRGRILVDIPVCVGVRVVCMRASVVYVLNIWDNMLDPGSDHGLK